MANSKRHIHVNAFNMNCVGHIHHGLWTHPRDQSTRYNTLQYWTDMARTLERGLFDGIFIADVIGYYDVYQGGVDLTLREGIQLPVNNPWLLVSAMAAVTQHIGFGLTATVGAHNPYTFARDVSTLDQLTNGRIGWNIVTRYVDSGTRGLGQDGLAEHDSRYDRADDFLDLSYKLWEGSWEDGAVVADKARRIHVLPDKVHVVSHEGPFYRTNAIHMSAPRRNAPPCCSRRAPRHGACASRASMPRVSSSVHAHPRPHVMRRASCGRRRWTRAGDPRTSRFTSAWL